jgi:hypothetical protein
MLNERERTVARQDETIRDLRGRLDASEAEQRELSVQVRGLLTAKGTQTASFTSEQAEKGAETAPFEIERPEMSPENVRSQVAAALKGEREPRPPWWRRWFR